MRSRGLVVAIAVVLAVLAAVGVIGYTNNVEKTVTEENTTPVVVSDQDITTGTALDPLLDQGAFKTINVPDATLVDGAVTTEDQLRGAVTSAPIYANEQIPVSRLGETPTDLLGVSEGHVGIGMEIGGPQGANGAIQQGSQIVMYATFAQGTVVTRDAVSKLLSEQQIQEFFEAVQSGADPASVSNAAVLVTNFDFTVTLVKSVKVLAIQNPTVDETTGRKNGGSSTLVLDLLPTDAQTVIFANEHAKLWLGLLPEKNEEGYDSEAVFGIPIEKLTGVERG
jgi:Flp pilus assembly protein CpaB